MLTTRLCSAPRLVTLLATAPRPVDTVVDLAVTRADTEAALVDTVVDVVDRPATLAVDTDTCLVRVDPLLILPLLTVSR